MCLYRGLINGKMTTIRVTKEFHFEMAHALWNYDGPCRNIHGHSYRLYICIAGIPSGDSTDSKFGMVIDFNDLKSLVEEPVVNFLDHSLVVYRKAEGEGLNHVKDMYQKVHVFDFQPTCENLLIYIVNKIRTLLPPDLTLKAVKLYETATSYAEWLDSDN